MCLFIMFAVAHFGSCWVLSRCRQSSKMSQSFTPVCSALGVEMLRVAFSHHYFSHFYLFSSSLKSFFGGRGEGLLVRKGHKSLVLLLKLTRKTTHPNKIGDSGCARLCSVIHIWAECVCVHMCIHAVGLCISVCVAFLGQTEFLCRVKNIGHISSLFLCKTNLF